MTKTTKRCTVDQCDRKQYARGWCSRHYQRNWRTGAVELERKICSFDGCGKPHKSFGYCGTHYMRLRRTGSVELTGQPEPGKCKRSHDITDPVNLNAKGSCKLCQMVAADAWREANPDRAKALARRSYLTNREERIAYAQRWQRENPDKVRRTNLLRLYGGDAETNAWLDIIRQDPCGLCDDPAGGTIDHIVPTHSGGENHWTNMSGACRSCNSRKRTTPLIQFLARRKAVDAIVGAATPRTRQLALPL